MPAKTFNSGDSNRDLHMLQVTRAGEFPMVQVRTRLPESDEHATTIRADLEIQFAGQTAQYKQIEFRLTRQGVTSSFPEPFRPNCRTSRSNHQVCSHSR